MTEQSIFKSFDGTLNDLFKPEDKYTFLAGAGISMDAPSNIPSARQIVWSLLNLFAPAEEVDTLFSLNLLRYELVIEKIQDLFDEDLKFLDYLELITEPNLIHVFLGFSILRGHNVITTNFDYLIEQALKRLLNTNVHKDIVPIITKKDYLRIKSPDILTKEGKYPIFKIHGSKKNVITDEITKESLITTISALGKEREEGVTFAIEPFKKPSILALMENRSLVVLGYSGSDDFDIGPTLKELQDLKRLIWIEHSSVEIPEVSVINKVSGEVSLETLSQVDKILAELRSKSQFEVIKIKANTSSFLRNIVWDQILPYNKPDEVKTAYKYEKIPNFGDWVSEIYSNVVKEQKFRFACQLLYDLKQLDTLKRVAEKGLSDSRERENISAASIFLNFLGLFYQIKGDYDAALNYYKEAHDIDKELNDSASICTDLSNMGTILTTLGHYEMALANFKDALKISGELQDDWGKINALNNIGRIYEIKEELNEALNVYNEAIKLSEKVGALGNKSALLNNIGRVFIEQGDYDNSYLKYDEAYHLAVELGDLYGQVILLNNIGRVFHEQDDFDKALSYYQKAIASAEMLGDHSKIAGCLNNIGSIHLARGELDLALNKYEQALKIEKELGDPLMQVIYLNNIGMIHASKQNFAIALKHYQDALEIAQTIKDFSKSALLLTKIGDINLSNNLEQALKHYKRALSYYELTKDVLNTAATLNNVARIHLQLNNLQQAKEYFLKTLELDKELGDTMNLASDFLNLAKLYTKLGDKITGLDYCKKALDIFEYLDREDLIQEVNNIIKEIEQSSGS